MRTTKLFSLTIAKWTLAFSCVAMGSMAMESQAFGHSPFHHRHRCFSSYGWGSHYYGGYSSFYGLRSSCYYPSVSFSIGYTPRYYSVNYFTPTYCAPVYYPPVYYPPVYYSPTYYPCSSWSNVQTNVGFPFANNNLPQTSAANWFATANQVKTPLSSLSRTFQANSPLASLPVAKMDSLTRVTKDSDVIDNEPGLRLVSKKPALLQPYSPIWTNAAAGIVDDMVAAGELDDANSSCKSMERITQPKGAGVYLRQALLKYFANEGSSAQKPSTDEVVQPCAGQQSSVNSLMLQGVQQTVRPCHRQIGDDPTPPGAESRRQKGDADALDACRHDRDHVAYRWDAMQRRPSRGDRSPEGGESCRRGGRVDMHVRLGRLDERGRGPGRQVRHGRCRSPHRTG